MNRPSGDSAWTVYAPGRLRRTAAAGRTGPEHDHPAAPGRILVRDFGEHERLLVRGQAGRRRAVIRRDRHAVHPLEGAPAVDFAAVALDHLDRRPAPRRHRDVVHVVAGHARATERRAGHGAAGGLGRGGRWRGLAPWPVRCAYRGYVCEPRGSPGELRNERIGCVTFLRPRGCCVTGWCEAAGIGTVVVRFASEWQRSGSLRARRCASGSPCRLRRSLRRRRGRA